MEEKRIAILIGLIVLSGVWLSTGCSALGLLVIAPMLFDAPGSQQEILPWVIIGAVIAAPIIAIIFVVVAWVLFFRKKEMAALLMLLIPPVVLMMLAFCGGVINGIISGG